MYAARSVPVVSVMYLPTVPLELARPCGKRDDFELRRIRADSKALAARTMTRARTAASSPVRVSTYDTPVAKPSRPTITSRTIALVRSVSLPVASAGAMRTSGLEKLDLVVQPRLHCPQ